MTGHPFTRKHEIVCRNVIYSHSQSFYLSSMLLPPDVRMAAWAIYGFCRDADDAVDEVGEKESSLLRRVEELRNRLDCIYEGRAKCDVDDAFHHFVDYYKVPRSIVDCLLDGFEVDAKGADFESIDCLIKYSFQVASSVGLMLTHAMLDTRSEVVLLKACDLGIAMQLTNIARDMGADFRMGRCYLPSDIQEKFGFQFNEDLDLPTESTREMTEWLLNLSRIHYQSARQGIQFLPMNCQLAITAAMFVYGGINEVITSNGLDNISRRAFVPASGKITLVLKAMMDLISTPYAGQIKQGPSDRLLKSMLVDLGLIEGAASRNEVVENVCQFVSSRDKAQVVS